jgi:hypothetical protein
MEITLKKITLEEMLNRYFTIKEKHPNELILIEEDIPGELSYENPTKEFDDFTKDRSFTVQKKKDSQEYKIEPVY